MIEHKATSISVALTLADIGELAQWALDEYGLTATGWTFRWDRAVRRAGSCRYRDKTITLSKPIFRIESNRDEVLNTILHEVAHALVGHAAGHGPTWRAMAGQVGARPNRCHDLEVPAFAIVGTCSCGTIHQKARLPRPGAYSCRSCKVIITWQPRTA